MLTIRDEQLDVFRGVEARKFEERTLRHMKEHWPGVVAELGESGTRTMIREGVDRAGSYGLVSEYATSTFINLMCLYGPEFPNSPRDRWAVPILEDRELKQSEKVSQLLTEMPVPEA